MTPIASEAAPVCPRCGAQLAGDFDRCWLCKSAIGMPASGSGQVVATPPKAEFANAARTFQLSSLMLVITLIAVCLGLFRLAPGLGLAAAVIATPALIRTMIYSKRHRAAGEAVSIGEKLVAFLGSVGVVLTICVGACAAFGAVCFGTAAVVCQAGPGFLSGWIHPEVGLFLLIGVSIILGLTVGGLLAWWLWPKLR